MRNRRQTSIRKTKHTSQGYMLRKGLASLTAFSYMLAAVFVPAIASAAPAFEQSSFRFLSSVDSIQAQYVTVNHSTGDDIVGGSIIDTVNGFTYIGGHNTEWIIEKRRTRDASLEPSFGTNGRINQDIAGSSEEQIVSLAIDLSDGSFFIAGWDRSSGNSSAQWRIEKRSLVDGSLITGFGTNGVVNSNPTTGDDLPRTIIVDSTSGHILIGGYDSVNNGRWRLEKRDSTTGNLDTGFATDGVYTLSTSGRPESINALAIDAGAGFFYLTGSIESTGNTGWRVEKRRVSDNAICTAANCGTEFGTNGVYETNPSSGTDRAITIQVDIAGNALYFGGIDNTNEGQWRVEKVTADTGEPITEFGTNGVITSNPGGGFNEIRNVELDGFGGFIYLIGTETTSGNEGWRIEKRTRASGALVTGWGNSGQVTINPSASNDRPRNVMIDVDRNILYAVGGDRTLGASNMRWRIEQLLLDTGGRWLGEEATVTVASTNISARLRMVLTVSEEDALAMGSPEFKLQAAFKIGTCDTAFVGEEYEDVVDNDGDVRYHDNPSLTDKEPMVAVDGDPSSGTQTIMQTYVESNTFNLTDDVQVGESAMWDLSIRDYDAFGAYCFRVVYADGTPIEGYTVVPEISFCRDDPRAENVMRHGTYFCEGTKRPFFWAREPV